MRLSHHFDLRELTRSDAAVRLGIDNTPPQAAVEALRALCVAVLEPVRLHFGRPLRVSSGYRCDEVNRAVGGNPKGSHPAGEAADFEVDDASNLAVARWIAGSGLPFDQVILEFHVPGDPHSGWVHASHRAAGDNRGEAWTMSRIGGRVVTARGLPEPR